LVFLLGNLERDLPGDSALPKSLHLKIPGSMVRASGKKGRFRDVTGSGIVKTAREPDGSWQVQLAVGANGSGVWVFEE